jgi:hypothetical protein
MLRLKVNTTVIPKSKVADFEMKVEQKNLLFNNNVGWSKNKVGIYWCLFLLVASINSIFFIKNHIGILFLKI